MFGSEQNDAENYIYDFFDQNYDNPYQNWGISEQRVQVLKLGFDIKTVEPIIADWIKGLKFLKRSIDNRVFFLYSGSVKFAYLENET